jgi:hypothetical protein
VLLSLLVFVACRKSDLQFDIQKGILPFDNATENKFFTVPAATPFVVKRIAEKINEQNNQQHFINRLSKEEGFAVWDKSQIYLSPPNTGASNQSRSNFQGNQDTLVIIPLVLDSGRRVNSFLACRVGSDSVGIKLFKGRRYSLYGFSKNKDSLNADAVANECMQLDNAVFGNTLFKINDKRLFNYRNDTSRTRYLKIKPVNSSVQRTAGSNLMTISVTTCYTVMHEGNQGQLTGEAGNYYWSEEICTTQLFFFPDYTGSGGDYGSGSTGPGGGAGGSSGSGSTGTGSGSTSTKAWWDSDPCAGYIPPAQNPDTPDQQGLSNDPCDSAYGWSAFDANGYYFERIQEIQTLISINPNALLPCNEINRFLSVGTLYQDLYNYDIPWQDTKPN